MAFLFDFCNFGNINAGQFLNHFWNFDNDIHDLCSQFRGTDFALACGNHSDSFNPLGQRRGDLGANLEEKANQSFKLVF